MTLYFLALDSVDLAIARVVTRVAQGGHDIPEGVIRRRFASGRRNLDHTYAGLVNAWKLYDNSGAAPLLLAQGENP